MSEETKTEKKKDKKEGIIDKIQEELNASRHPQNKIVDKVKDQVMAKIANVRDFQEYYRPYQEKRTLMWNELGSQNSYDVPININAGKPLEPANFAQTITLYYNDPSREQMNHIERLRGTSQDLDRQERVANTLPLNEIEKKGMTIPKNYLTISTQAAQAKEDLLIARIVMFCGVNEETAKNISNIAHSGSLDDILDSWEYRARTGFPNSQPVKDGMSSTSQSGLG